MSFFHIFQLVQWLILLKTINLICYRQGRLQKFRGPNNHFCNSHEKDSYFI
jgi:hypothetical protein